MKAAKLVCASLAVSALGAIPLSLLLVRSAPRPVPQRDLNSVEENRRAPATVARPARSWIAWIRSA